MKFHCTSRRDDIISLFYMLVYMLKKGEMPGYSVVYDEDELEDNFVNIQKVKAAWNTKDLCFENTFDLKKFKREVFAYSFKDTPDYAILKQMLANIIEEGIKADEKSFEIGDEIEIGADVELRTLPYESILKKSKNEQPL